MTHSKTRIMAAATIALAMAAVAPAAEIRLDNDGSSTGANLDETTAVPSSPIAVDEIPGLTIIVTAIDGAAGETNKINATADSLGVDAVGTTVSSQDDTDQFDAALSEAITLKFNQGVSITSLDLVGFETGETFEFGSQTINYGDLANATTDVYDFGTALNLSAGQEFTISASSGTIGIEGITLTVVAIPAPAAMPMAVGLFGLAAVRRRRA